MTSFSAAAVWAQVAALVGSAAMLNAGCSLLVHFGKWELHVVVSITDTTEQVGGSSADTISSDFDTRVELINSPISNGLDSCFADTNHNYVVKNNDCCSFTADVPSNCFGFLSGNCCLHGRSLSSGGYHRVSGDVCLDLSTGCTLKYSLLVSSQGRRTVASHRCCVG